MQHIFNSFLVIDEQPVPKWEKTPDGFLRCRARILAERIMPYAVNEFEEGSLPVNGPDVINMYVSGETLADPAALRSLEGSLVVAGDHAWCDLETVKQYAVGHVVGTPYVQDGYVWCELLITDQDTIDKIVNKELGEISAAYLAESVFEPGEFNGQAYDARQEQLQYNHVAVLPIGHGRAGRDVRIMNKKNQDNKGVIAMPDDKDKDVKVIRERLFRVKLANTGKFINADEETANAVEEESKVSGAKLETTMSELETKNAELAELQAQVEELKGQLSVYKEKLDQLLSEETIEHAAEGMLAEGEEAGEIIENSTIFNEKGEEEPEEKKKEFMNSVRKLHGTKLHSAVLGALGVKTEGMSPEAIRGSFKAQHQICNSMKGKRTVAGTKMFNNGMKMETTVAGDGANRSGHQRLGFGGKK